MPTPRISATSARAGTVITLSFSCGTTRKFLATVSQPAMKGDDDGASGEKEERFEKRVSEKVKHRRFIRGESDRHNHVTKLGNRGVSEDPFDVGLLRRH